MKRYLVSKARERLADVLDEAERSGAVVIQRGERQYVVTPRRRPRASASESVIEVLDPAVATGEWSWDLTPKGLRFKARPSPT